MAWVIEKIDVLTYFGTRSLSSRWSTRHKWRPASRNNSKTRPHVSQSSSRFVWIHHSVFRDSPASHYRLNLPVWNRFSQRFVEAPTETLFHHVHRDLWLRAVSVMKILFGEAENVKLNWALLASHYCLLTIDIRWIIVFACFVDKSVW